MLSVVLSNTLAGPRKPREGGVVVVETGEAPSPRSPTSEARSSRA